MLGFLFSHPLTCAPGGLCPPLTSLVGSGPWTQSRSTGSPPQLPLSHAVIHELVPLTMTLPRAKHGTDIKELPMETCQPLEFYVKIITQTGKLVT